MGSLIPDTNYTPNTTAASNAYVAAQNNFSDSLTKPAEFLHNMQREAYEKKITDQKLAIQKAQADREQVINARQDVAYNRDESGRQALQDYASKPLDIGTMLGTQTKSADEAIALDANRRNALWTKSLSDNNVTQEDVDKGRVAPEVFSKLYNPALDATASAGIQKTYENITPFREDVESRIEKDLIAKNVDPLKAKQYAQMEGQKYQSIPEYQAMLTAQAEKMTNNSKEQFKDNLELTKFNRETYKDELDKYKIKMDNLTHMMGSAGAGGTGGSGGGLLGGQDKSKIYEKVWTKSGNPEELSSKLDAAFQIYGARAVNNALTAAGIDEPVRLYSPDFGNRDVALDKFDAALKSEKPLSEIQGQFGNGAPNAPTYSLPTPATVYTADSARAAAQDRVKNSVLGYLGDPTSKDAPALLSEAAKGTTEKKSSNTLADRNNNWGNIKYDKGTEWQGGTEGEKGFVKFDTPELGARALAKTIMNGGVGKTVDQYINKYAPASDNNDTKSYINEVAKTLGKKPDERITLDDVPTLMQAIAKREGGNYSKDVLDAGYKMAVSPQLTEFHKAVNAKDGSANKLLGDMSTKFNDKSMDWSNGTSNADVSPITDLFGKVNTSRYGINAEVSRSNGGVGGENPDQKIVEQRIAEINGVLGANPAPTPENLALMDERSKLNPRSIGSKTMDYVDTLRRELIDPLGPSGYAVGGIPKIGTGLGRLGELLTPTTKPMVIEDTTKLLENLRPQGSANWTGTGKIATDKLNGISADTVLGQAGNQGNKLAGALRNADESKRLLEETPQTNLSNLNYFSNTSLNKLNLQAPVDARRLLDGAIEARSKGQIDDAKLFEMIQKIDDTKLLNPRELMEALDRIGFKR